MTEDSILDRDRPWHERSCLPSPVATVDLAKPLGTTIIVPILEGASPGTQPGASAFSEAEQAPDRVERREVLPCERNRNRDATVGSADRRR